MMRKSLALLAGCMLSVQAQAQIYQISFVSGGLSGHVWMFSDTYNSSGSDYVTWNLLATLARAEWPPSEAENSAWA